MRTHRWFLLFGLLLVLFALPGFCEEENDDEEITDEEEEEEEEEEDEDEYDEPAMFQREEEEDDDDSESDWFPIWNNLGCPAIFAAGPRPVHATSDWMRMRQAYIDVLSSSSSSQKITIPNPVVATTGFAVSVEARQAGSKGRGVFVTETPVKKGQKVWSTLQTARFENGDDYRRFLRAIPNDLACDVLQWAYVQSVKNIAEQTEKPYISADLDEGSFINSYEDWNDEGIVNTLNLGCDEEMAKNEPGGCQENYFALRDIAVGEELLLDYRQFAIYDGWEWFGPWDGSVDEL